MEDENKFLDRLSKWWRWLKGLWKKSENESFQKLSKKREIEKKLYFCTRFENTQTLWVERDEKTRRTRS
jgi:hypothetical protein